MKRRIGECLDGLKVRFLWGVWMQVNDHSEEVGIAIVDDEDKAWNEWRENREMKLRIETKHEIWLVDFGVFFC